jgi:hypothetical protein
MKSLNINSYKIIWSSSCEDFAAENLLINLFTNVRHYGEQQEKTEQDCAQLTNDVLNSQKFSYKTRKISGLDYIVK